MNWRKNVVTKKGVRYAMFVPRFAINLFCPNNVCSQRPPVLANSFPKSGTFLLMQILQALPRVRDWGLFLASTPSLTLQSTPEKRMSQKIQKLAPGELVGAHLFHSDMVSAALKKKPTVHYFIYRDPRDVVISEAHYLSKMNRWHRLSKYFRKLPNIEQRILFSITGTPDPDFPYDYPNVAQRFQWFHGWLNDADVFSLKFEDLISKNKEQLVRKIIKFYLDRSDLDFDQDACIAKALNNIDPAKSHTYRQGKTGGWCEVFTEQQKTTFKELAGDLLIELGYEQDKIW